MGSVLTPKTPTGLLVAFWKAQGAPQFDAAFAEAAQRGGVEGLAGEEEDEYYQEAVSWVVRARQASTSLLQRRLKIGYSRAARLLDVMEQRGVVGPPDGSKPRKVLISTDVAPVAADASEDEA